jgi:hypothetical protein
VAIEKLKPIIKASSVREAARMRLKSSFCSSLILALRLRHQALAAEASDSVTKAIANARIMCQIF